MRRMRCDRLCCVASAAACLLAGGCQTGSGDGWIVGSVVVDECRGAESLARAGDYDLGADFFAADPLHDASETTTVQRNSLTVRIQHTSNRVEESDGMVLHLHDTAAAARAFVRGEPVPAGECLRLAGCPSGDLVLRAHLNLYNTCPANRSALAASSRALRLVTDAPREGCLRPEPATDAPTSPCPEITEAERAELEALCDGDFNDRSVEPTIQRILGRDDVFEGERVAGGACVFFCALGKARRGQPAAELAGFEIDFGDRVAAIFSFNMVDARAFELEQCATARAQLHGRFSFEVVRSRTAQAFP